MKFFDTKGREHSIDIRPSKWERRNMGEGKGKFQSQVGDILSEVYPSDVICEEFPCSGEGLHLDFFVPRKKVAIEVQGRQHHEFVEFFHRTRAGFLKQKECDARKAEWCELNKIQLIKIDTGEKRENILKVLLDS